MQTRYRIARRARNDAIPAAHAFVILFVKQVVEIERQTEPYAVGLVNAIENGSVGARIPRNFEGVFVVAEPAPDAGQSDADTKPTDKALIEFVTAPDASRVTRRAEQSVADDGDCARECVVPADDGVCVTIGDEQIPAARGLRRNVNLNPAAALFAELNTEAGGYAGADVRRRDVLLRNLIDRNGRSQAFEVSAAARPAPDC